MVSVCLMGGQRALWVPLRHDRDFGSYATRDLQVLADHARWRERGRGDILKEWRCRSEGCEEKLSSKHNGISGEAVAWDSVDSPGLGSSLDWGKL